MRYVMCMRAWALVAGGGLFGGDGREVVRLEGHSSKCLQQQHFTVFAPSQRRLAERSNENSDDGTPTEQKT
ncbi:hypothetical protein BAUCODRAFT_32400 [Baudoinia panamericana UAMH 10762]|uniref:Uncharacterized protein n=1 Tax=Baudoinia panamericana (strain UAMH 10762) TaxID=717646 RepID=M2NH64_BAUPA|nr:uncharacterized protein BAUCODRAFT_32400 [Baudoinia panamericana UAMH 10762]EMC98365.1 hypothetical protein BAUCODRAFT_32400 [Baudoinia panamericana UAMH 10762]